jgi:hypothetical protein
MTLRLTLRQMFSSSSLRAAEGGEAIQSCVAGLLRYARNDDGLFIMRKFRLPRLLRLPQIMTVRAVLDLR